MIAGVDLVGFYPHVLDLLRVHGFKRDHASIIEELGPINAFRRIDGATALLVDGKTVESHRVIIQWEPT